MGTLHFEIQSAEQAPTKLAVAGELDIASAPQLRAQLDHIVRREEGDVVVDLRELQFIDSTGLAVLLNAVRRLTRAGRRFELQCPPGPVRASIERARLGSTLGLTD